jgi:hypothetical protein
MDQGVAKGLARCIDSWELQTLGLFRLVRAEVAPCLTLDSKSFDFSIVRGELRAGVAS